MRRFEEDLLGINFWKHLMDECHLEAAMDHHSGSPFKEPPQEPWGEPGVFLETCQCKVVCEYEVGADLGLEGQDQ
jgi:hypothetical protein